MSNDDDLFDTVVSAEERAPFRQAPPGHYLVTVRSTKRVKANSGSNGIEVTFTMNEAVGDQDMEGVDLARCRLRDTLWVTQGAQSITSEKLLRMSEETTGQSYAEAMETVIGSQVVVLVSHETHDRSGAELSIPRLKVERYYSTDWWFDPAKNKRAA